MRDQLHRLHAFLLVALDSVIGVHHRIVNGIPARRRSANSGATHGLRELQQFTQD
jgi:hypothetical protein